MIDHLELIRIKTEGNLNTQETKILTEALQQVQLAFVEASGGTPVGMMPDRGPQVDMSGLEEENLEDGTDASPAPTTKPASPVSSTPTIPEEDKKKYFKSYG